MAVAEEKLNQFCSFPQENLYYDMSFAHEPSLYIVTPQEGWTLIGLEEESNRGAGTFIEEFVAPVSKECKEFCDLHGLNSILAKCLRKAKEIFSNIEKLSVELDHFRDNREEDSTHIAIRVEVNSDQKTVLKEYDRWVCWIAKNLSPNDSKYFTLTVKRV